jgi:Bifunctional DNA primase/polymerase, N-terminal
MITPVDEDFGEQQIADMIERAAEHWTKRWRLIRLYLTLGWYLLPLCWPAADGRCGCGRKRPHEGKGIVKAPLLSVKKRGALPTADDIEFWFNQWPRANIGVLLNPSHLLVVDQDSRDAINEATARGLRPGPRSARTVDRLHDFTAAPPGVAGFVIRRGQSGAIDVLAGHEYSGHAVLPPSIHRSGESYRWVVEPGMVPLPPTPDWALAFLREGNGTESSAAVALPADLPGVDVGALPVPESTGLLIVDGLKAAPGKYKSRSELVCGVILRLMRAGCDNATIASVLLDPRYGVSECPRERGDRWLATEIGRIRDKVRSGKLTLDRGYGGREPASGVVEVEIG